MKKYFWNLQDKFLTWVHTELSKRQKIDDKQEGDYNITVRSLKDTVFTPLELKTLEIMRKEEVIISILEKLEIHSTLKFIREGGDQAVYKGFSECLGLLRELILSDKKKTEYNALTQEEIQR